MGSYIIDGVRSAIGKFTGALSTVRADDLAATILKALLERNQYINPYDIEDVILGCANQAGEDNRNVARMVLLLAGYPYQIPGETVNRLCASGMSAVAHAHHAIAAGCGHLFVCGGVEHMTRGPWVISKTSTPFGRDAQMFDSSFGWRFVNPEMERMYGTESMGETAENLVELFNISREDQDKFAFWSQMKASQAQKNGILKEEIVPIEIKTKKGSSIIFETDEFVKPETTLEKLAALKPAFRQHGGTVTAGNSSGLNDGAAAILVASDEYLAANQIQPLAKILGTAVSGVEPRIMGIGPVEATKKVLNRTGLSLDQMDIIEINEAFAAQVLACTRSLGLSDDDPRINPNGGAIALGHPLGMSGTRIILAAVRELNRSNKKFALCTMCVGVGQGYAVVLERC